MKLKNLLAEDRAVSPVIGVILMVAITVILAAVIGTFVLGLGDQVSDNAPQASFNFDFSDGNGDGFGGNSDDAVTIAHEGGETIENSTLDVSGDDDTNSLTHIDGDSNWGDDDVVSAGDRIVYENVDSGETLRVVWTNPNGGSTNTIARSTAPQ